MSVESRSPARHARAAVWAAALLAGLGCGTVKQSGTARTGTEQLLLTNAWDRALQKVDFRPLTGVPVFLDTANVNAIDQGWVVSSLRQAMLTQGVLLRQKAEQAQYIVEARIGAYGTDDYNWMIGIPQLSVPPTITGVPTGTIPEIPFVKKSDQHGVAKLAMFAYDRASGQVIWTSGTQVETSSATDRYIGGFGPLQSGTIRGGAEIMGVKVPIGADGEGDDPPKAKWRWWRRKKRAPAGSSDDDPAATIGRSPAPMAAKSDLDSFRP